MMKAITVEPKKPGTVRLEDIPEPDVRDGSILVEAVAAAVCGTDIEIAEGKYGWAPPGRARLVLGHESLGRVIDPGTSASFKKGDLVAELVRRPDPVPCPNRGVGESDMCRNGRYTERGIKEIDGFMSERWRIEPEYAIKVDPTLGILGVLIEPTTVIIKALEQVLAVGQRSFWEPKTLIVTGAGPIGLLAAAVVLKNNVVVGSVNANKRHWYKASERLARLDRKWLSRLITRFETPENFKEALERQPDDIKVVIQFSEV
ncbi:MAG: alcohol dehydrogenase catalytic domain-containing protein [Desulfobacterales bacterium]|jgi:threonine dehydrogenase-like Zn-dependent dehydrogenase|nr:alcohol dehydrogenase catalytic domain-containing protein [Desulfobacterales bacterium]